MSRTHLPHPDYPKETLCGLANVELSVPTRLVGDSEEVDCPFALGWRP
jgi:hypothetical protein